MNDLRTPDALSSSHPADAQSPEIDATRLWLERSVIGLNLCPFAKPVYHAGRVRFVQSNARQVEALCADLQAELLALQSADPAVVETTVLIAPDMLGDFLDYNDFLDLADALLEDLGLEGELQIASFHPQYQFGGTAPNCPTNLTNCSPYPTLHLLREASVERAVDQHPDIDRIPEKNMAKLREMGETAWRALMAQPR
jgi:hypothetical protein